MAEDSYEHYSEATRRPLPKQVALLRKKADQNARRAAEKSCLRSKQFNSTPILPGITITPIRKPETATFRNSSGNVLEASPKHNKLPPITTTDNNNVEPGLITETTRDLADTMENVDIIDYEKMYERMNFEWEHMKKFRIQAGAIVRQAFLQYAELRAHYSTWLTSRYTAKRTTVSASQENCIPKVDIDSNLYSWIATKAAAANTQNGDKDFVEVLTTKVDPHVVPEILRFPPRHPSVPCAKQAQGDSNNSNAVNVRRLKALRVPVMKNSNDVSNEDARYRSC